MNIRENVKAKNVERNECFACLGLLFLIGLKKYHHANVKEVFATDGNGFQFSNAVMSYKRFLVITRCLIFDDVSTRNQRKETEKLAFIRKLFNAFVNNCESSVVLSEYTTIDEMHPFRGRCS